jgi:hypothetical protein
MKSLVRIVLAGLIGGAIFAYLLHWLVGFSWTLAVAFALVGAMFNFVTWLTEQNEKSINAMCAEMARMRQYSDRLNDELGALQSKYDDVRGDLSQLRHDVRRAGIEVLD